MSYVFVLLLGMVIGSMWRPTGKFPPPPDGYSDTYSSSND